MTATDRQSAILTRQIVTPTQGRSSIATTAHAHGEDVWKVTVRASAAPADTPKGRPLAPQQAGFEGGS